MKKAIAAIAGIMMAGGIFVSTANAMIASEQYGWYDGYVGETTTATYAGGGDGTTCGTGTKTLCQTIRKTTCVAWRITDGSATASSTGGTVGISTQCAQTIESVVSKYYP